MKAFLSRTGFGLMVGLVAPAALAQSFTYEEATGSVWTSNYTVQGEQVAEWRTDGTYTNYVTPFNPFTHHDARVPYAVVSNDLSSYEGQFAVGATYRGFYVRNGNGGWTLKQPFAQAGMFGCSETVSGNPCITFGGGDGRGRHFIAVRNENMSITAYYWTGNNYRPATALEMKFIFGEIDATTVQWSDDESFAVVPGSFDVGSHSFTYSIETATTTVQHAVSMDEIDGTPMLFLRNGHLYAAGHKTFDVDSSNPFARAAVYEIVNFSDAVPSATPLLLHSATTSTQDVEPLSFEGTGIFLLKSSAEVMHFDLLTKVMTSVMTCESPLTYERHESMTSGALLGSCGSRLFKMSGGVMNWELTTAGAEVTGSISEANVLTEDSHGRDVVVKLRNGDLYRYRDGQAAIKARTSSVESAPAMSMVWEESDGRVCGVLQPDVALGSNVVCRADAGWAVTTLPIGIPYAHRVTSSDFWVISKIGSQWTMFRKSIVDTAQTGWQAVQSWNEDQGAPKLLAAFESVAVDFGKTAIWTFNGSAFVETHHREGRTPHLFRGGLDKDQNLYEPCAAIDEFQSHLCRIKPDGTFAVLSPTVTSYGSPEGVGFILPLARGALFVGGSYSPNFVLRDTRSISLGDLHGELASSESTYTFLSFVEAGNGDLIVRRSRYDQTQMETVSELFTFNGMMLTPATTVPPRHRLNGGDPGAYLLTSPSVWLGADGLWRFPSSMSPDGIEYGVSAVEANSAYETLAPNHVNQALKVGSLVVLATNDGIWTCPLQNATVMAATTTDLPRTLGCERIRRMPRVAHIYAVDSQFIVQQGRRILMLSSLRGGTVEVLSETLTARQLSVNDGFATWIENDKIVRYEIATDARTDLSVPSTTASGKATGDWYCEANGLFHQSGGVWSRVLNRCLALTQVGSVTAATDSNNLYLCDDAGGCQGQVLPRTFFEDSRLGSLPAAGGGMTLAVSLGEKLYALGLGATLQDVSLTYGGDTSVMITDPASIDGGYISLNGGGVVALPAATGMAMPVHVRVE